MRRRRSVLRATLLFFLLAATLFSAVPASAGVAAAGPSADPAFAKIWARNDQLVRGQNVDRSWTWGSYPFARVLEPFAQAPGGTRLVEYYDKSRMEVNDPAAKRSSEWFVTNGLLVRELMSGQIVTGMQPDQVEVREPSLIPVAGDIGAGNKAPSYAALGRVATLNGDANKAADRSGKPVAETMAQDGAIATTAALGNASTGIARYVAETGHNIPKVFWDFLNTKGQVLNGKFLQTGPLFDWLYVMGYPITEPYWVSARIGGTDQDVLVQAFERRILTYNPANAPAWQVEMGNVGRAYYGWRYGAATPGLLEAPPAATRIVIPKAEVDTAVIPTYVEGAYWQVAANSVGWLYSTALPGQPGNSVFAGHNNSLGEVFRYLDRLSEGDEFTIYTSDDVAHRYRVSEVVKVQEAGASLEQQKANASYMRDFDDERVTLITCWPYTNITHRLIVIARPVS